MQPYEAIIPNTPHSSDEDLEGASVLKALKCFSTANVSPLQIILHCQSRRRRAFNDRPSYLTTPHFTCCYVHIRFTYLTTPHFACCYVHIRFTHFTTSNLACCYVHICLTHLTNPHFAYCSTRARCVILNRIGSKSATSRVVICAAAEHQRSEDSDAAGGGCGGRDSRFHGQV